MEAIPVFEYRRLDDFTYHILTDPREIRRHLRKWIQREWELDHNQAPHEHWTVEWLALLPKMEFSLEIVLLDEIHPHADLMRVPQFLVELQEPPTSANGRSCAAFRSSPCLSMGGTFSSGTAIRVTRS